MKELSIKLKITFKYADDALVEEVKPEQTEEVVQQQEIYKQLKVDNEEIKISNHQTLKKKFIITTIKDLQMENFQNAIINRMDKYHPEEEYEEWIKDKELKYENIKIKRFIAVVLTTTEGDLILVNKKIYMIKGEYTEYLCPTEEINHIPTTPPLSAIITIKSIGIKNSEPKYVGKYQMKREDNARNRYIERNYVYEATIPKEYVKYLVITGTPTTSGVWKYYTKKETILMNISEPVKYYLRIKDSTLNFPSVIVFDAPDGSGKSTNLAFIKEQLTKDGYTFTHNEFSYKRKTEEEMLSFRLNVAKTRNRRILEYKNNDDYIIIDKSPYVEYYYQKTDWQRNERLSETEERCLMEEVFRLKHVLDNASVIILRNANAWNNYIAREKLLEGKTNFPSMEKKTYNEMKKNFETYAKDLYKGRIIADLGINNDDQSWKIVYKNVINKIRPRIFKWSNVEEEIPSIEEEKNNNNA